MGVLSDDYQTRVTIALLFVGTIPDNLGKKRQFRIGKFVEQSCKFTSNVPNHEIKKQKDSTAYRLYHMRVIFVCRIFFWS